jgi:prepilin-type N-terminal cleavage/methylation domain-containing protein
MTTHCDPSVDIRSARLRRTYGFTMLEVAMALVLFSLLLATAIPSISALTGAELRSTMSKLQGLTRDTYARTALTGNSHRIVLDLEGNAFWVEATEGGAVVKREVEVDPDGTGRLDIVDERITDLEPDEDDLEAQEKLKLYMGPTWQPVDDEAGKPLQLPEDTRILSVWVEHLDDRVTSGKAAIHFFPGGYMQEAQVIMTDDDSGDSILALVTNPLTGETYVDREMPKLP